MLLFIDGMHHYATGQLTDKWTEVSNGTGGSAVTWSIAAEGRSANCIKVSPNTGGTGSPTGFLNIAPLKTEYGTWTPNNKGLCGFAIKVSDLQKLSTSALQVKQLFAIYEGGGRIFYVTLNQNGTFSHYFHEESALATGYVGSSVQGIRSGIWAYLEFKWTVSTAADAQDGSWQTWMNATKVYDLADQPLTGDDIGRVYGSSSTFDYLGVWTSITCLQVPLTSSAESIRMCDFYLADQETHSTDYVVSDLVHDASFGAIYGNAVGDLNEWTPSAGDNFDCTNEHPPNDDTDTVSATAPGKRDRYNMDNVPAGAVILGYQALIRAKKTTDGNVNITPQLRIGGVDYPSDAQGVSSVGAYEYIRQVYDNNPATLAQLTEAEANALQGGFDN